MAYPASNQASKAEYHGDASLQHQAPKETGLWSDLMGIIGHSPELVSAFTDKHGQGRDGIWQVVAALPEESHNKARLTTWMVDDLWSKLKHPPLSYLGDKFQYRTPDGSYNSVITPLLGKAGTPYAKSVASSTALHGAKPDPGDLFDLLMARDENKFSENPKGLSSMILYHATIVIHDIFRSNPQDPNISGSSSYLDLAPLYGSSLKDQIGDKDDPNCGIRLMRKGLLKPDSFSEKRLLGQPPGVAVLLIMYNRFHNYIAEQLLAINDSGRFSIPEGLSAEMAKAALNKQDDDLFNTARLVTCGLYASISVFDYLRGFMGTHSANTAWTLDPRQEIGKKYDGQGVPRGIGNQVSVEFNMLYRFHSALSQRDAKWTERFFGHIYGNVDVQTMPLEEFGKKLWAAMAAIDSNPCKRYFQGVDKEDGVLQRQDDGKFKDEELMKILKTGIEDPAGSFGARNVPKILRVVEILGILQARKWQLCTLNEFRTAFGMSPHTTFESINVDHDIQDTLRDLYEHPDMVELYPGIFCEGNGQLMDAGTKGAGSLAMWTGIFSDAVTLVRSDRFYTVDWNVTSLTAWGMKEVSSNAKVLKGSMFYKLIQRAFPGWFKYDSIYLWQPMYTPKKNLVYAKKQKLDKLFVEDGPKPPTKATTISDYSTILAILKDHRSLKNPAFAEMAKLDPGPVKDFLTTITKVGTGTLGDELAKAFKEHGHTEQLFLAYFCSMAKTIEERERCKWVPRHDASIGTFQLDMVRDFATPIFARFVGDLLGIELSGKTQAGKGIGESQFYKIFTDYQHYLNYDADETSTWKRRAAFLKSVETCVQTLQGSIHQAGLLHDLRGAIGNLFGFSAQTLGTAKSSHELRQFGAKLVEQLSRANGKMEALTTVLMTALDGAYNTVLMFCEILEFFLENKEGQQAWSQIRKLATSETNKADAEIKKYVLEAQRITMRLPMVRVAQKHGKLDFLKMPKDGTGATGTFSYKANEILVLDLHSACHDEKMFPNPKTVDLKRDPARYISYNRNQSAEAEQISTVALTAMIKFAATMRNLRPSHDAPGSLKKVSLVGGRMSYMTLDWAEFVPYPTTWKLRYDQWDGPYVPYKSKPTQSHDMVKIWRPKGPSSSGGTFG